MDSNDLSMPSRLARLVQDRIEREEAPHRKHLPPTSLPELYVIRDLLVTLYYVSLKTEEGRSIQARVYYVDPDDPDPKVPRRIRENRWRTFPLGMRIPLTTQNLAKFAKSADPWATGIAVFHSPADGLFIWGLVDQVLHLSTTLVRESEGTYIQPGAFQAVINGPADITVLRETSFVGRIAQDVLLTEQNDCLGEGPIADLITQWLQPLGEKTFANLDELDFGFLGQEYWVGELRSEWVRTLCRVLIQIQRQRHGGAILISPSGDEHLLVKHKFEYPRLQQGIFSGTLHRILNASTWDEISARDDRNLKTLPRELFADHVVLESECEDFREMMAGAVQLTASLAGVDGLVLASPNLSVRGYGTMITSKTAPDEILISPSAKRVGETRIRSDRFGSRHRSMFSYCTAHPGAIGFVISQDGDIRAIASFEGECVLFDNIKVQGMSVHPVIPSIQAIGERTRQLRAKTGVQEGDAVT